MGVAGGRVLLLFGALALFAGCGKSEAVRKAERTKATMHLHQVKLAVSIFLVETGKLPARLEDLEKPIAGKLDRYPEGILPGASKDPWGRPLIYETSGDRKFLIRSLGEDGKAGGTGPDADLDSDHLEF